MALHGGMHLDYGLLGCDTMCSCQLIPVFQMNVLLPLSKLNYMVIQKVINLGTSFMHRDGREHLRVSTDSCKLSRSDVDFVVVT